MTKPITEYAYRTELSQPYDVAVERVIAVLKEEGFGVLTEIDVKATLKNKLNKDFRRYTILGACNPPLAYQALQEELDIGLLLPCNVIVYEQDSGSVVSIIDPISMLGIVQNPSLEPIANEAQTLLRKVFKAVQK